MPPLHSLCLSPNPSWPKTPTRPTIKIAPAHLQTLLPLPDQSLPIQFKEKILALEIMGVDTGRALAVNPTLQTTPLSSIHSIISFLQSKGLHQKDMGRIFDMCPAILTADVEHDLSPVFHFLSQDLHVPQTNFRRPINKCPRLLISSVRDQLKPALIYLQRLGIKDMEGLAYNDPVLLVSSVERTLMPKMECLVGLGFSEEEAAGMVVRCPGLFTFSVERNLKPKFEYYVGEMEGSLEELKGFPQYFGFSLEKRIRLRHREGVERGVKLPLGLMLKATDEEFRKLLEKGE
ncbi:transcription termination factor MTEF1, chloroplastic [Magnolia sinica]|uniref:transcription termination factor MTEF1, chloroplastic n=1 Tax=Magnolia sinica TaxID=86752 RepID=UPI002658CE51|nr:transcription termination factor MTEF1, chloroplastic [Magnolia sinica]